MTMPVTLSMLAQALGWTVLHSLWQIAIIWGVFKALSLVFSRWNQLIYLLSLVSMLTITVWFSITFSEQYASITLSAKAAVQAEILNNTDVRLVAIHSTEGAAALELTRLESARIWLGEHAVQVGWAWSFCVALLWLRLLGGWWMVQRLRRRDVVPSGDLLQERCSLLAKKLRINALVRLLESPHVSEPLTLGFLKPVILFPTGMLLSLSPAQVEALLLHELAHIRRHDYLINLFQLTLETCFFYHPLFWLISRDARVRREFCCDDVVLFHTSDPILYARTLTDLQLTLIHPTTQFTMNATGKSRFTERILRIAGVSPSRNSRPNWMIVMLLPVLIAICSWWPSQAATLLPDNTTIDNTLTAMDSLPPKKVAQPAPKAALPKETGKAADPGGIETTGQPIMATSTPKVAIEAVRMNVFYIGVDNPLKVAVSEIPANELTVKLIGNGSIMGSEGSYIVQVTQPGEVTIRVSRNANGKETLLSEQKYRVKRIPDPVAKVAGESRGGTISKARMLTSTDMQAMLENFDFDASCVVVGYSLTIMAKEQDPVAIDVKGSSIPSNARQLIENFVGDGNAVFFDDIKVKCPGDKAPRNIGGLAFKVKAGE